MYINDEWYLCIISPSWQDEFKEKKYKVNITTWLFEEVKEVEN